jgi:glycosyltransferase involved in cell wall biosynthesis
MIGRRSATTVISRESGVTDSMNAEGRTRVDVSVVIASVESKHSIRACLDSVRKALVGTQSEVLVVDASRDESGTIAERELGSGGVLRCPPGTLTPDLWAVGIARTTGRVVALTTGHFVVEATWLASLMSALQEGEMGAAGRMDLANETAVTDWAVFYLRYSEFLGEPERIERGVPGIPADNAAYDGDAIRRFVTATDDGFWEVEFHRHLHTAGGSLALVSGATASYGRSFPFLTIAGHRYRHGRHSGAWRVSRKIRSVPAIVVAFPLVPFALAARTWRRVRASTVHRSRFLRALPQFLVLASLWAVGEAVGALSGAPPSRRSAPVPA